MKIAIGIFLPFIQFYMVLLLARVVIDIVSMILRDRNLTGFALVAANVVYKVMNPPLHPFLTYISEPMRLP